MIHKILTITLYAVLLYQQVSGQMMQNLLEQYSNNCSHSTPDLTNTTAHTNNPLVSEPMTSFFCNQKHIPVTRPSHQKSSLKPISSSWSQKEKKSSEPISFSFPNKQSSQHLRFKTKPTFTHM